MKGYKITDDDTIPMELLKLEITGNILPPQWLQYITTNKGKPYAIAAIILSDIVYWYRPILERDENTGQVIGYSKKYKADLLQKRYDDIARLYGFTKRQVQDAIKRLEELGLIKRNKRTITTDKGVILSNVIFLELRVEKLKEITIGNRVTNKRDSYHEKTGQLSRKNVRRSTETTTENTSFISDEQENIQPALVDIPQRKETKNDQQFTLEECLQYSNKPANEKLIADAHATTWILHYVMGNDPTVNFSRYARLSKALREQGFRHGKTNRTADLIFSLYNKDSSWWQQNTYYGKMGFLPNETTIKNTIQDGYEWHKDTLI